MVSPSSETIMARCRWVVAIVVDNKSVDLNRRVATASEATRKRRTSSRKSFRSAMRALAAAVSSSTTSRAHSPSPEPTPTAPTSSSLALRMPRISLTSSARIQTPTRASLPAPVQTTSPFSIARSLLTEIKSKRVHGALVADKVARASMGSSFKT